MTDQKKKLGSYLIEREVGRGGMGVVYLARDPRLDREVAIKVLPDDVARDPERLARFEREARLLASLSHPNIAGIYGIEEDQGTHFLCLEYIEGPTLEDRLASGALPVDEALSVCRQIAAALETAHENGIIHRDLKPANVKLTSDGEVKVLDFGLAKGVIGASDSEVDMAQSPTITAHFTAPGVILGTAAYMSPEQARGKPVDRRTDIFSFGCVLFECLTGRQVFAGETVSDTIAKILEREPDWTSLPGSTPEMVLRVLRRCLEKDARKRQRDIGDARLALEEVEDDRTSSIQAAREMAGKGTTGGVPKWQLALAWGVAALAIGFAILVVTRPTLFGGQLVEPSVRFTVLPPQGVPMSPWPYSSAIAPDGRSLIWRGLLDGTNRIYLRSLNTTESLAIPGTEFGSIPFWSPDGESIAFFDQSKLRKVSIEGGDPEAVCDATSSRGGDWGKEYIVFALEQGPIYRVPATGGTPAPVTTLNTERGETAHRFPKFLPDGETFLYAVLPAKSGRITIFGSDVHGRKPVEIVESISGPVYSEGYLIYQRGRRLLAQRLDPEKLELSGDPVVIGEAPRRPPAVGAAALTASRNGHLAMTNEEALDTQLAWLDRNGEVLETLELESGRYVAPEVSPDGRYVAMTKKLSPEESDIWVLELGRMVMTRLTSGSGNHDDAVWSPGGDYIAYSADREGPWNIYRKPFPGGGDPEPVVVSEATFKNPLDWSSDGRFLLYEQIGTGTNMDLWVAPADGNGAARPYLEEIHQEEQACFSPDGRWMAYISHETGKPSLYLNSFPEPGRKYRLYGGTGFLPTWPDNDEVLFLGGDGQWLMQSHVQVNPLRAEEPEPLLPWTPSRLFNYDVAPDGRILVVHPSEPANPAGVTVVLNWTSDLEELR